MMSIAKKRKKPNKTTLLPNEPVPEGPFAPPLLGRKFKLPRLRDRQAFELSQEGKTQAEIAEKLGCSQATVCRGIGRVEELDPGTARLGNWLALHGERLTRSPQSLWESRKPLWKFRAGEMNQKADHESHLRRLESTKQMYT